jgi:hypothetical protein
MKEIFSASEEMSAISTNLKNKKGKHIIKIIIYSGPGRCK